MKLKKEIVILSIVIIIKFILSYNLVHPPFELQRDEYLHLDLGRHLAWGYSSVPPFTGILSYLILHLGNSVFWVKFFPTLFGALTILAVWMLVKHLKGGLFALLLSTTAVTLSVIMRINILYQPNSFDILSWTLVYLFLIKYLDGNNKKWIWLTGLIFAVGFLNKYNIVFQLMGLLPALLLTKHRIIFLRKELYIAAVFALIIIFPNLLWQQQNHYPVVHHMKELATTQLVNIQRSDFIKEQVLFFVGSLILLIAALVSFFLYPPFKKYRFIFLSYVITLTIFIYLKAKPYYAIGLYPVLLAFGSVYLEKVLNSGWKLYLRPVLLSITILIFIPFVKRAFPIYSPEKLEKMAVSSGHLHTWEDGKTHVLDQDFADMLGWKELTRKVDSAYSTIQDKEHTLILCDNYGEAGAVNFFTRVNGLEATSFNADYINWMKLDRTITTIISVKETADPAELLANEKKLFNSIRFFGKIENKYAREFGTSIYILSGPKFPVNTALSRYRENLLKSNGF